MIGKLLFLGILTLIILSVTGTDLSPLYKSITVVRNNVTPTIDHTVESTLQYTATHNINQQTQPAINLISAKIQNLR